LDKSACSALKGKLFIFRSKNYQWKPVKNFKQTEWFFLPDLHSDVYVKTFMEYLRRWELSFRIRQGKLIPEKKFIRIIEVPLLNSIGH